MSARNVVLILTQVWDVHSDIMVRTLQTRHPNVEVVRFHPAMFPQEAELEARVAAGRLQAELRFFNRTVDLTRVRSVWFRRPERPKLSEELPAEYRKWAGIETEHALNGLLGSLGAFAVNPAAALREASYKLRQLVLAQELGFRISPTLVTNRPDAARAFVDSLGGQVVLKSLARPVMVDKPEPDNARVLFTNVVSRDAFAGEQGDRIRLVPVQLQGLVKKDCDLRVTVIGTQVFAVALRSESDEVDIRKYDQTNPQHSVFTLPEPVERQCLELVRRLGLVYGAIDLLLTPEGEYIFLEINPCGQFGWLEDETGLPMMATMADLLVHGPERSDLQR